MKKLIAILLVCMFVLSMAACGKKNAGTSADQPTTSGTTEAQTGETAATEENAATQATTETTDATETTEAEEDPTKPSENNKVETTEPPKNKDDDDDTIKIDIAPDTEETTPDKKPDTSFVIDFDDLMDAANK